MVACQFLIISILRKKKKREGERGEIKLIGQNHSVEIEIGISS